MNTLELSIDMKPRIEAADSTEGGGVKAQLTLYMKATGHLQQGQQFRYAESGSIRPEYDDW